MTQPHDAAGRGTQFCNRYLGFSGGLHFTCKLKKGHAGKCSEASATPAAATTPAPRTDFCTGFLVKVHCHTQDAFDKITSPEALRFQIGHMLDSWGIQEEVDYTLEVSRVHEN